MINICTTNYTRMHDVTIEISDSFTDEQLFNLLHIFGKNINSDLSHIYTSLSSKIDELSLWTEFYAWKRKFT